MLRPWLELGAQNFKPKKKEKKNVNRIYLHKMTTSEYNVLPKWDKQRGVWKIILQMNIHKLKILEISLIK